MKTSEVVYFLNRSLEYLIFFRMKTTSLALLLALFSLTTMAQSSGTYEGEVINEHDHSFTKTSSVVIKGERIDYEVTFGKQPVYSDDDHVVASLFYTFYQKADGGADRPLMISFNGGPGSASLWMHLGYTSPVQLNIDPEGNPIEPYGVHSNPHSILDVTDIVYVNPVNVGFSRAADSVDTDQFFGVNEDIDYLARWIETFVSRNDRWTSPKFLIGESYGTNRVSGLAARLQGSHWMYLNGVILVSPTGLGIERQGPVAAALRLPYFAATAWYHNALDSALQEQPLVDLLDEVESYTLDTFLPAIARGGSLDASSRTAVASQAAQYSGLSAEVFEDHSLNVSTSFFWKDLLRDEDLTVGRLDSRYRGSDKQNAGERYDYDPAMSAWNHAFAPAINHYLREVLEYDTSLQYNVFGPVHPWNRDGDKTGENLRSAMAQNPNLYLFVQSGYFDGGTDYFNAKYTMWNLDPSGRLQDRMTWEGYESGHMMYLREEDLETSNEHIREFVQKALQAGTKPAKY